MTLIVAISLLVGFVVAGSVFFGWSLVEHVVGLVRQRRAQQLEKGQEAEGAHGP